jgi:hypothetical protein
VPADSRDARRGNPAIVNPMVQYPGTVDRARHRQRAGPVGPRRGRGCPRMPGTTRWSASSRARTSSSRGTRRSASATRRTSMTHQVADRVRAHRAERRQRGKDRRAREESGELTPENATRAAGRGPECAPSKASAHVARAARPVRAGRRTKRKEHDERHDRDYAERARDPGRADLRRAARALASAGAITAPRGGPAHASQADSGWVHQRRPVSLRR